jgi:hypothetical protein
MNGSFELRGSYFITNQTLQLTHMHVKIDIIIPIVYCMWFLQQLHMHLD